MNATARLLSPYWLIPALALACWAAPRPAEDGPEIVDVGSPLADPIGPRLGRGGFDVSLAERARWEAGRSRRTR
jgi:hypothetical protein